jgi:hypothetical protein
MALHTFTEPTYVVIHGTDGYLQYSELDSGTELETPHTVEIFTDEDTATARATELGWVAPPDPEDDPFHLLDPEVLP